MEKTGNCLSQCENGHASWSGSRSRAGYAMGSVGAEYTQKAVWLRRTGNASSGGDIIRIENQTPRDLVYNEVYSQPNFFLV